MQCVIGIIYDSYKSGTQNGHGSVSHYALKTIMIDAWPCLINSARMKEYGRDQNSGQSNGQD